MTSEEFADQVTEVIERLRGRILGTGAEQYAHGDTQEIEDFTNQDLVTNAIEEIEDAIVYMAHLRTRFTALSDKLEVANEH